MNGENIFLFTYSFDEDEEVGRGREEASELPGLSPFLAHKESIAR